MIYSKAIAKQTATYLLKIKAVELNNTKPFQWASGWKAPIYCDNRKTLSYPEIRTYLRKQFEEIINREYPETEVIAGVATGGIAMGALIAQALNKPFVYIRNASKGHGLQNRIEGVLQPGQKTVVIEDLVSTGKSSLNAVDALNDSEANVLGMVSIFDYGFQMAVENFENHECDLLSLSDYEHLLEVALQQGYVHDSELAALSEWRLSPEKWGTAQ